MKSVYDVLEELGFEQREAQIYTTLIRDEELPALQLARKLKIDRTTVYDILDRLIAKGIVSVIIKNKSKHFRALSPRKLLANFKDKYFFLESELSYLESLARNPAELVSCEIFYGEEGIKSVIKGFLQDKNNYKIIGIKGEYEEVLGYFSNQILLRLYESRRRGKAIVQKGETFQKLKNEEYRYIGKTLDSSVTTLIYGDTTVFFIWTQPYYAISVKSKEMRKAQEEYFQLLWSNALP